MEHAYPIIPFLVACQDTTSGQSKVQKRAYKKQGAYPVIDQGQEAVAGYTDEAASLYKGDLPVVLFGDHTRAFKYVDQPFALGADGVKVLSPNRGVCAKYLYYRFLSNELPSRGYSRHFKFLKQTEIPLPPPSEQRRIVELLDQADALRKKRAEADKIADRILPSLFYKMFGDPATNPKGWDRKPIGKLAHVSTGNTPPRKNAESYGDHLEWVKSDNINTPSHYITRATEFLSQSGARIGRTAERDSTLVTCIAGSPSAIGNAAFADRKIAFNQQINAAAPREGVDAYYLYGHFVVGKPLIQAASSGGMKGIVSKSRFSGIEFLSPPRDLQQVFGRLCKTLCDQNEDRIGQAEKLNTLSSVLLHRAFSGDLTANWREAHMKELLQEMKLQARELDLKENRQ